MSELHCLALMFKGPRQVNLVFLSKAKADEMFALLTVVPPADSARVRPPESGFLASGMVTVIDDYGTRITLSPDSLEAVMQQEMGRALEGSIEMTLAQERANARARRRAQADPMIGQPQQPVVIPPFRPQ